MIKFPYARPHITKKDIASVTSAMKNQYLTGGPVIKSFERELCKSFNVKNAIVCNSGTAALHLIYKSLGLCKGDAILTTPITFIATANAARMCGANVHFVDVDPDTGLIIPELIEAKLKNKKLKIKIVTVVHLGGRICDLEKISKITNKYNCFLVEDACHAPGTFYKNKKNETSKVGSCKYSIASSFSFHAIKNITMAEGGCITTNNNNLSKKVRLKLNHSMVRKPDGRPLKGIPWLYEVSDLGWNYRASELNCALGLSQLSRLEKVLNKRKKIAATYKLALKDVKYLSFPKNAFSINNAWHLFTIFIEFNKLKFNKSKFVKTLQSAGIGTQVHYIPIFKQPYYKLKKYESFKGSEEYYQKSLSIPMYENLQKNDILLISKTIQSIIESNIKNY
ncbi:MAG: UDP-4-amino-4,6-dideoxy-N-acetyl-beta-L-altrosamine transaminase [Phycisphaerae bacterium]|nr:UDP-4-amino-4,6-dideoxy-N-acetyl-beta-L-altrosamine transaminase [Phycisphaerae bacterium]